MTTMNLTDFRSQASEMFARVENGETILVKRHGKLIAEISPVQKHSGTEPSWKRSALRLVTNGKGLSSAILQDRDHADVF